MCVCVLSFDLACLSAVIKRVEMTSCSDRLCYICVCMGNRKWIYHAFPLSRFAQNDQCFSVLFVRELMYFSLFVEFNLVVL